MALEYAIRRVQVSQTILTDTKLSVMILGICVTVILSL